jgi:phosphatidylglycerophosphatase A
MDSIKESSDELNPSQAVPAAEIAPRKRRTFGDFVAFAIATCGVGYAPIAPGTLGSIVAIFIYLALRTLTLRAMGRLVSVNSYLHFDPQPLFVAVEAIAILLITLIGIWAASQVEKLDRKKDPAKVVIDEVAGQLIALLPIPIWAFTLSPWPIVLAFLLFRTFDIVKPFPIRRLEKLESGLGIMADDLAAGAYAALLGSIAVAVWLLW